MSGLASRVIFCPGRLRAAVQVYRCTARTVNGGKASTPCPVNHFHHRLSIVSPSPHLPSAPSLPYCRRLSPLVGLSDPILVDSTRDLLHA